MQYWKRGDVDMRSSAMLALGLFAGALVGARLGLALSPRMLKRVFAVFLVLVSVQLWFKE